MTAKQTQLVTLQLLCNVRTGPVTAVIRIVNCTVLLESHIFTEFYTAATLEEIYMSKSINKRVSLN